MLIHEEVERYVEGEGLAARPGQQVRRTQDLRQEIEQRAKTLEDERSRD